EYAQYLDKTHTNTQSSQEQANFSANMGNGLAEFGGALMMPVLGREDKQTRAIREFHENQRDEKEKGFKELVDSLPQDLANLSEADVAKLKTAISGLQADSLL